MLIAGLQVEVLVVVKENRKLKFEWNDRVFDRICLVAFGLGDPSSPKTPILVFNKKREYTQTLFASYRGGHQNGPILEIKKGVTGGVLVAQDYQEGDQLLIVGHPEVLTEEMVKICSQS